MNIILKAAFHFSHKTKPGVQIFRIIFQKPLFMIMAYNLNLPY